MKKKLFLIITATICLIASAQTKVDFFLTEDGTFKTQDGKNYAIVPFENKTQQEIYQILATNANSIYNDLSKVMSSVEYSSIKIRAIKTFIRYIIDGWEGYYQLEFQIKDGKVKVFAPFVEKEFTYFVEKELANTNIYAIQYRKTYASFVSGFFKNHKVKEKKRMRFEDVFTDASTREEVVTYFLAVLELLKLGQMHVRQKSIYGGIELIYGKAKPLTEKDLTTGLSTAEERPETDESLKGSE